MSDPFNAPREGFIPAEVGDYAAFEKFRGKWYFGQVTQVTKNPPRVRTLLDNKGDEHTVGPRHHIRLARLVKVDPTKIEQAWKAAPIMFASWEEVRDLLAPCRRSHGD